MGFLILAHQHFSTTERIKYLMRFTPNVERSLGSNNREWHRAKSLISASDFEMISAAAYLKNQGKSRAEIFSNSQCDMLFELEPKRSGWSIEIVPNTKKAKILKQYIKSNIVLLENKEIDIY